jgi:hypothetical protein
MSSPFRHLLVGCCASRRQPWGIHRPLFALINVDRPATCFGDAAVVQPQRPAKTNSNGETKPSASEVKPIFYTSIY